MVFDEVIVAHSNWKKRFVAHIEGREKLAADVVAKDNACEFGKWLNGEGQAHAARAEFKTAREAHTEFHRKAAAALNQAARASNKEEALTLVGLRSDYSRASANCVTALTALRDAVGGARK
ncbi:MAG: CZB domain-containing protein [Bryobacterales bacterium]|nr:CZB domain-containing protein [Bryobacterales bacterium]